MKITGFAQQDGVLVAHELRERFHGVAQAEGERIGEHRIGPVGRDEGEARSVRRGGAGGGGEIRDAQREGRGRGGIGRRRRCGAARRRALIAQVPEPRGGQEEREAQQKPGSCFEVHTIFNLTTHLRRPEMASEPR